jgi:CRP-like cAMP-binding protein
MEPSPQFAKIQAYYLSFLPGLTGDAWELCTEHFTVRTLKKGEFLQKQGVVANHVSFLNYGLLRMYHLVDGREKISEFFKEGDYAADYRSFLMREPANTYVQALEDTEVVDLSFDDLQEIYKQIPEANYIGRLIAEELFKDMCRRTTTQVTVSIDDQYAAIVRDKPWLVQRVPQYMIASYLGVTPEALSRIKSRAGKRSRKIPLRPVPAVTTEIISAAQP